MKLQDMEAFRVVPLDDKATGALLIVHSDMTDETLVREEDLQEAFAGTFFEDRLPSTLSDRACLTKAVEGLRSKTVNADRLTGSRPGYQITFKETNSVDDLVMEYTRAFSVYLDGGVCKTTGDELDLRFIQIKTAYEHRRNKCDAPTLKVWVQTQLRAIGAVKVADHGHVYFAPPSALDAARVLREGLEQVTPIRLALIGVGADTDLVDSVLRGLTRETEQLVKTTFDTVFESETKPGPRAINTQLDTLAAAKLRLEKYAAILGHALPEVTTRIDEVKAAIVATYISDEPDWEEP